MAPDDGRRTVISVPEIGDGYLIAMPFAEQDQFVFKIPYENRADHAKWRQAFDAMLDVVNLHVAEIHEYYQKLIDELQGE